MTAYDDLRRRLAAAPHKWLVTGVAGFIGSNLLEALLKLGQHVVGLDDFSTGFRHNLADVQSLVTPEQWRRFTFIEGDIRNLDDCRRACAGVAFVLHQAAIGSVPRSIADPIATNAANITGFLNMLVAARDARVSRLVFASSSSVYGDHPGLPKTEDETGRPLSPYAVTKRVSELYADVFARNYGFGFIGLRYFNVFGRRQDPDGPYAAVIPKWFASLLTSDPVLINGDGETSRDFSHVENAVQANLLAALSDEACCCNRVYNIAVGQRTTLNQLFDAIRSRAARANPACAGAIPSYREFRAGDIRHSIADIGAARRLLRYNPSHDVARGLDETADWYIQRSLGARG